MDRRDFLKYLALLTGTAYVPKVVYSFPTPESQLLVPSVDVYVSDFGTRRLHSESLSDLIYNIQPTETPFLHLMEKRYASIRAQELQLRPGGLNFADKPFLEKMHEAAEAKMFDLDWVWRKDGS
jgi:hypothetical protein